MKDIKLEKLVKTGYFNNLIQLKEFLKEYKQLTDSEKREAFVRAYWLSEDLDDALYKATRDPIIIGDKEDLINGYVDDYLVDLMGEDAFDKVASYIDYDSIIRDWECGGEIIKVDDPDWEHGEIYVWCNR